MLYRTLYGDDQGQSGGLQGVVRLDAPGDLKGDLLLIHGLLDENVHYRHTARLLNALVAAGKPFSILPLPDSRHAVRGTEDRRYVATRMLAFFERPFDRRNAERRSRVASAGRTCENHDVRLPAHSPSRRAVEPVAVSHSTDPVLKNARREAIFIGLAWLAATTYTLRLLLSVRLLADRSAAGRRGHPSGLRHAVVGLLGNHGPLGGVQRCSRSGSRAFTWSTTISVKTARPSLMPTSAKGASMNKVPVLANEWPPCSRWWSSRWSRSVSAWWRTSSRRRASFLEKYFLGNRSLGAFAVALTAAVMSGGTFVGFPSLVYSLRLGRRVSGSPRT